MVMTLKEYEKSKRLLQQIYKEIELEALGKKINVLSPEYDKLLKQAKKIFLENNGFTEKEYDLMDDKISLTSKEGTFAIVEEAKDKIAEFEKRLDSIRVPTYEEIVEIAEYIAKKYVVEPKIINQIVKETTVEQPKIIETTKVVKEKYDDTKLLKRLAKLDSKIAEILIPDEAKLKESLAMDLQKNIEILGMPDFRKLGMGLQAQIDELKNSSTSSGVTSVIAGTGINVSSATGDVTITNSAPDQTVALSNGTGISVSGTYPNFTITNSAPATIDGSGTTNEITYWVDSNTLGALAVATYPSLTELSYVKGVSSAIQTQLGTKAPTTAPTFATSITGSYLTASEILITDGSKNIVSAPVATYPSLTELSYVKGLSSAVQTQLNGKAATTTTITINGTANQITSSAGAQDLSANRTWTLSLPADVIIPTVLTVPNTGLHLLDTNASHDLIIKPGSDLSADRTLTLTTGNTDMIVDFTAVTDEYVLAYDTSTNTWRGVSGGGAGANTALSNLASVAINTSLVSDTDSTDNLGSSSVYWANTYTDKIYLNGTATLDGTVAGVTSITGGVKIAGTATRGTTEGTNHLDIFNGTAPVGTLTNGISLYSSGGELYAMNDGGDVQPITYSDNIWMYKTVSVSSAEIQALNTSPKELIAAPGAGKALIVDELVLSFTYGGTQYTSGGAVKMVYRSGTTNILGAATNNDIAATIIQAAASSVNIRRTGGGAAIPPNSTANTAVDLYAATGNFATGNGTAKAFIKYHIITL